MGFLSFLDPGEEDRAAAADLAGQGVIEGVNVSGPGGITAGTGFADGQSTTELGLGSFDPLLTGAQGIAQQGFAQAGAGFDEFNQFGDFGGLGQIFQQALGTASADPFDLGADVSQRLRQLSERRNQRTINKTFDRLFAGGNLGSSAGVARAGDLERNIFEQGLQFDLAGLEAGRGIQKDAFGRALGAQQGRGNIFEAFLRNQAQGANIGFGGIGAASGLAQLPLAFLQAGGNQAALASNSLFGAAGVNQTNAANARSPFLEALNAAGGIASSVAPGGFLGK
jgi:hypothetical protein